MDPDQTPHSSDLGLHCLPMTLLRVSGLPGKNGQSAIAKAVTCYSYSASQFQQLSNLCMDFLSITTEVCPD